MKLMFDQGSLASVSHIYIYMYTYTYIYTHIHIEYIYIPVMLVFIQWDTPTIYETKYTPHTHTLIPLIYS